MGRWDNPEIGGFGGRTGTEQVQIRRLGRNADLKGQRVWRVRWTAKRRSKRRNGGGEWTPCWVVDGGWSGDGLGPVFLPRSASCALPTLGELFDWLQRAAVRCGHKSDWRSCVVAARWGKPLVDRRPEGVMEKPQHFRDRMAVLWLTMRPPGPSPTASKKNKIKGLAATTASLRQALSHRDTGAPQRK